MKTYGRVMGCLMAMVLTNCLPALAMHEKSAESRVEELSRRIDELEKKPGAMSALPGWLEKITISGLLETEAGYAKFDPDAAGESDTNESDITLSTFELGLDAQLNDHVSGHALALWEEDETEPMDLDEGFITFTGTNDMPAYLHAGKLYAPFGVYETVFISDPSTLELGETSESAVVAGYHPEVVDVFAGAFNGDVNELGKDDHINGFFAGVRCNLPKDENRGVDLSAGVSWISNIADSDGLAETNDLDGDGSPDGVQDLVGGIAAHMAASFHQSIFCSLEYVGAVEDFKPGELAFGRETDTPRPAAWTAELSFVHPSSAGGGLKYEETEDCGDFLPEHIYGGVVFYRPFDCARLALEYQYQKYTNDDINHQLTAQLALEF